MDTKNRLIYNEAKDLVQDGKEKCGTSQGNIAAFKSELDNIVSGRIIDSSYVNDITEQQNQKLKIQSKLEQKKELELECVREKSSIKKIEEKEGEIIKSGKIVELEKKNDDLQSQLDCFLETGKNPSGAEVETFSTKRFVLILAFIIPISFYLFMFYTGTIYKALSGFDLSSVGTRITLGEILPSMYDLQEAMHTNILYFLVPFVFFGFGFVLHMFFSRNQKLYAFLILAITLILDVLIAWKIHNQILSSYELMMDTQQIEQLMSISAFKDLNFYIVLFLGFIVFIIWSLIFDFLLKESEKKDISNRLKQLIKQNNQRIEKLNAKYQELFGQIEKLKAEIQILNEQDKNIPLIYLKDSINKFSSGWIMALGFFKKDDERLGVIEQTNHVKDEVINQYFSVTNNHN